MFDRHFFRRYTRDCFLDANHRKALIGMLFRETLDHHPAPRSNTGWRMLVNSVIAGSLHPSLGHQDNFSKMMPLIMFDVLLSADRYDETAHVEKAG